MMKIQIQTKNYIFKTHKFRRKKLWNQSWIKFCTDWLKSFICQYVISPRLDPLEQVEYVEPNQSIKFSLHWRGLKELVVESPGLK